MGHDAHLRALSNYRGQSGIWSMATKNEHYHQVRTDIVGEMEREAIVKEKARLYCDPKNLTQSIDPQTEQRVIAETREFHNQLRDQQEKFQQDILEKMRSMKMTLKQNAEKNDVRLLAQ